MSDVELVARRAGLQHLGGDRPGIRRRRRGKGFSYVRDGSRRPLTQADRERISTLAIPPAWTDVWIAPEADAHLQATGVDAAGRKQYLYHPAWTEASAADKFEHLATVAERLPRLRQRVAVDLADDGPERGLATVVRLIDRGLIRPGSDRASDAVGATTLQAEHVEIDRGRIVLDFVGKSAVEQHIEIEDPDLADALTALLARSSFADVQIFAACVDQAIDASRVNRYLAEATGASVTAKDLRTWGASAAAVECLCDPLGGACDEPTQALRQMYVDVSERLGNTVAVCRSSYVAPLVVDAYEAGRLIREWQRSRAGRWMSRPERALARLLSAEQRSGPATRLRLGRRTERAGSPGSR